MRSRAVLAGLLVAAAALTRPAASAQAEPPQLVADLSDHLIAITSAFTGTNLLVFGAIEGKGDVVVIVRGPREPVVVRKKERVFGIWINAKSVAFSSVPVYYAVAATRPLDQIGSPGMRQLLEMGLDSLRLKSGPGISPATSREFEGALIAEKQAKGLYVRGQGKVDIIGGRLFRTQVSFPASVPVGTYIVDVFLVRDGAVVAAQSSPLVIDKAGFGAEVYDFAYHEAALYGLLAVIGAAVAGFLGDLLFRRP